MPVVKNSVLDAQNADAKKKRTPELIAQENKQKSDAAAYIQQREKIAANQNISSKQAGEQMIPSQDAALQARQAENINNQNATLSPEQIKQKTFENLGITSKDITTPELLKGQENMQAADKILSDVDSQTGLQTILPRDARIQLRTAGMAIQQAVPSTLAFAADIIDAARVAITGKKPLEIQQAEGSFNDAITILGTDVEAVKAGLKPARDAKISIILAQNAINRLESTQKGLGIANVRYWSDQGAEIEGEIIMFKKQLTDLERELLPYSV